MSCFSACRFIRLISFFVITPMLVSACGGGSGGGSEGDDGSELVEPSIHNAMQGIWSRCFENSFLWEYEITNDRFTISAYRAENSDCSGDLSFDGGVIFSYELGDLREDINGYPAVEVNYVARDSTWGYSPGETFFDIVSVIDGCFVDSVYNETFTGETIEQRPEELYVEAAMGKTLGDKCNQIGISDKPLRDFAFDASAFGTVYGNLQDRYAWNFDTTIPGTIELASFNSSFSPVCEIITYDGASVALDDGSLGDGECNLSVELSPGRYYIHIFSSDGSGEASAEYGLDYNFEE